MANQGVVRMLFTGLARLDDQLIPQLELAESYRISSDYKTYLFTLKDCHWSDGSPITAYDFEQTWKAALTPAYSSANTNLFFTIKNGQKAFLGQTSMDQFGVKALSDKILSIELEEPNPHFLNILINSIFSPVHESMRFSPPDADHLIVSGPFCLKKYLFQDQIILKKNPHYWNSSQVPLQELHYYIIKDPATALLMFEKGEIDWMGEPLSRVPLDAIPHLKAKGQLHSYSVVGTQWMFLNTNRFPLNNSHIRKALAYAIDREKIMRDINHSEKFKPSLGLIPKILKKERWHPWFKDHDIMQAKLSFEQGLQELGITASQFPVITIFSGSNNKVIQAIQQMWQQNLGIKVHLESMDGAILIRRYYDHDYEITWLGWVLQYNDPINMLEIFKLKNTQPNYSGWENPEFIRYANASYRAATDQEKWDLVESAEAVFCREMPSIPVTDLIGFYLQQPYVKGVVVNQLFQIDFDKAFIEH